MESLRLEKVVEVNIRDPPPEEAACRVVAFPGGSAKLLPSRSSGRLVAKDEPSTYLSALPTPAVAEATAMGGSCHYLDSPIDLAGSTIELSRPRTGHPARHPDGSSLCQGINVLVLISVQRLHVRALQDLVVKLDGITSTAASHASA